MTTTLSSSCIGNTRSRGIGRIFVGVVLVALNVDCFDSQSKDSCGGGCAWGGGAPHSYTTYSGGTTETLSGQVSVPYSQGEVVVACATGYTAGCTWSGGRVIAINGAVPNEWTMNATDGGDAGDVAAYAADGGGGRDDDADAGVDEDSGAVDAADAPDAPIGTARGWGKFARVAVIDLGSTNVDASSTLVDAKLIYCDDPFETLVSPEDGGGDAGSDAAAYVPADARKAPTGEVPASTTFMCQSAGLRPPRIEPLDGRLIVTGYRNGETTSSSKVLDATSGGVVTVRHLTWSRESSPLIAHPGTDCY